VPPLRTDTGLASLVVRPAAPARNAPQQKPVGSLGTVVGCLHVESVG